MQTLQFAMPIAEVMEAETVADAIDRIEQQMVGLHRHYSKSEDDVFYKDPPFLYLAEYARRYGAEFFEFIDHVEDAIAQMVPQSGDSIGHRYRTPHPPDDSSSSQGQRV